MRGIYRFKDIYDNIIYIGKAININNRLKDGRHRGEGHLPEHAYNDTVKIEFTNIDYKSNLTEIEKYYITKHNPKYNTQYADHIPPIDNIELDNAIWTLYWKKDMVKYDLQRFMKDYVVNCGPRLGGKRLVLNIDMSIEEFAIATSSSGLKHNYECYLKGYPYMCGSYRDKKQMNGLYMKNV